MHTDLLVVGAQEGSLGDAIARRARGRIGGVLTAGLHGPVDIHLDAIGASDQTDNPLEGITARNVVTTIGLNQPLHLEDGPHSAYRSLVDHFNTNVVANLMLFHWWRKIELGGTATRHFVAISSNSAHIARTGSMPYCTSKAALSMMIRTLAREVAMDMDKVVYCYEPGWIDGTPMSEKIKDSLNGRPPHRILTGGVSKSQMARMIVDNLGGGLELNGTCIRIDGGEQ